MKVVLFQRKNGYHKHIKEVEIEGVLSDYYRGIDTINENLLLDKLPEDFLPINHSRVLLSVAEVDDKGKVYGSIGQRGLISFMNWAKYFNAYSIELQWRFNFEGGNKNVVWNK